ncbi:MAG: cation-translocating P-type ATPase, partial [Gammaproteobacteria bacterium]|nr:cation-translocating P-type ATPase [Gammaproteobacteria bacterium]
MALIAEHRDDVEAFDFAEEFVTRLPGRRASAWFIVEGLTCAGCARKFERAINDVAGIDSVALNFTTRRAQLVWDSTRTRLSALLRAADRAGFKLIPYDPSRRQQSFDDERRYLLRRVLISGLLMMQVMACSLAIYFGNAWGMAGWTADMFRWLSLGMTLPVYAYCAQPFLAGALRDCSRGRVSMDVPIAVALTAALIATVYGCITRGEIYCDSIVMFTFLLLLARLLELNVRGRAAASIDALDDQRP